MQKFFPAACVGMLALALGGCGEVDPAYSSLVSYPLRTDPLVLTDKLGDEANPTGERFDPDRPGQLPLFSMKDVLTALHPFQFNKSRDQQEFISKSLLRDPMAVSEADRQTMDIYLTTIFGTPANPTVGVIDDAQREALKLDNRTLERGSMIYRVQCLHCHGVPGDGRGPTSRWVNPHPRDYRQGLFKFQSVDQTEALGRPPRRADLHRVIKNGIEGTAMPSFVLLSDSDIDLLVSYVIHLSIRGNVEYEAFKNNFELDDTTNQLVASRPIDEFLVQMTTRVGSDWADSQQREIKIAPYPYQDGDQKALRASVQRGQKLFLGEGEEGKAANCVSCHADYGQQAKFRYDAWGTLVRPNNLTNGIYRGGRRTVDIFYRVHSGINGSGMASFGKVLKSESLWDLVNFVKTLPYPAMRRDLGVNIEQ